MVQRFSNCCQLEGFSTGRAPRPTCYFARPPFQQVIASGLTLLNGSLTSSRPRPATGCTPERSLPAPRRSRRETCALSSVLRSPAQIDGHQVREEVAASHQDVAGALQIEGAKFEVQAPCSSQHLRAAGDAASYLAWRYRWVLTGCKIEGAVVRWSRVMDPACQGCRLSGSE